MSTPLQETWTVPVKCTYFGEAEGDSTTIVKNRQVHIKPVAGSGKTYDHRRRAFVRQQLNADMAESTTLGSADLIEVGVPVLMVPRSCKIASIMAKAAKDINQLVGKDNSNV